MNPRPLPNDDARTFLLDLVRQEIRGARQDAERVAARWLALLERANQAQGWAESTLGKRAAMAAHALVSAVERVREVERETIERLGGAGAHSDDRGRKRRRKHGFDS